MVQNCKDQNAQLKTCQGIGLFDIDGLLRSASAFEEHHDECPGRLDYEIKHKDLDFYVQGSCTTCQRKIGKQPMSLSDKKNIRSASAGIVSHLMNTGCGYTDLVKLTSELSFGAKLNNRRYYDYHNVIANETQTLERKNLQSWLPKV